MDVRLNIALQKKNQKVLLIIINSLSIKVKMNLNTVKYKLN